MPDAAATQIAFALSRLALYQRAAGRGAATPAGLGATQAAALRELAQRGPQRVGALAAALGVRQPTLSESLATLEAKGLVARTPEPGDARAARVSLTADGQALTGALPAMPDALADAISALPETGRGALMRALTRLVRALQEARAMPVQRMCATCRHFRPHAHADDALPHHCGFVDAAFGDDALRIDCPDHQDAPEEEARRNWARFAAAG